MSFLRHGEATPAPRPPGYGLAVLVLAALALELTVWFSGVAGRDTHLLLVPVWLSALLLLYFRYERYRAGLSDCARDVAAWFNRIPAAWFFTALLSVFGIGWAFALACKFLSSGFSSFDTGIYSSIAFNSAAGHLFYSSVQQMNHLGEHFSPAMIVFAPLYKLYPHPLWLFASLLGAYLSVPVLIYWACRKLDCFPPENRAPGYLLGALWLLYRPMMSAVEFAFHPSTLAAPFIIVCYCLLERKRWAPFYGVLFCLLFFKENLALAWIGFGLFMTAEKESRWRGAATMLAGGLAAGLTIGLLIPYFRQGPWESHMARLAPWQDLGQKGRYLFALLAPLLFLPLARWRFALPALPAVALNLATGFRPQYGLSHHYDDLVAPLLFVGVMAALAHGRDHRRLDVTHSRRAVALCGLWLLLIALNMGTSPWKIARRNWPTAESRAVLQEARRLQAELPQDSTMLYIQSHLDLHFQRYRKRDLPGLDFKHPPGDAVIILSRSVNPWPADSIEPTVGKLESRPAVFTRRTDYRHLLVYVVRRATDL